MKFFASILVSVLVLNSAFPNKAVLASNERTLDFGTHLYCANNDETCNNNKREIEERIMVWKDFLLERIIFYLISFCVVVIIGLSLARFVGLL